MSQTANTPRACYYIPEDAYVEGRGFRVAVVTEGQPGYQMTGDWPNDGTGVMPYFWGNEIDRAKEIAAQQNRALGHSDKDVIEIMASSMGAQIRQDRK